MKGRLGWGLELEGLVLLGFRDRLGTDQGSAVLCFTL